MTTPTTSGLDLGDNQITDVSPLAELTSLTTLLLWYNQISDISPLANLTSLTRLALQGNQISHISTPMNLTSLRDLELEQNQITDISGLVSLASLEELTLQQNQITDISPLANLSSLTSLNLLVNQISDIPPLPDLTSLIYLSLHENQISDISGLQYLVSLRELDLETNQISDIAPLANLTEKEEPRLAEVLKYNLRTVRAYLLREDFQFFWDYRSPYWAGQFLDRWCRRTMRSRLEPMKKVARSLRKHRELLLNWFRAKGAISAGVVEGFNNKAKLTMRKAYGFRTYKAMEVALYHTLGNLPEPQDTHRFC